MAAFLEGWLYVLAGVFVTGLVGFGAVALALAIETGSLIWGVGAGISLFVFFNAVVVMLITE